MYIKQYSIVKGKKLNYLKINKYKVIFSNDQFSFAPLIGFKSKGFLKIRWDKVYTTYLDMPDTQAQGWRPADSYCHTAHVLASSYLSQLNLCESVSYDDIILINTCLQI